VGWPVGFGSSSGLWLPVCACSGGWCACGCSCARVRCAARRARRSLQPGFGGRQLWLRPGTYPPPRADGAVSRAAGRGGAVTVAGGRTGVAEVPVPGPTGGESSRVWGGAPWYGAVAAGKCGGRVDPGLGALRTVRDRRLAGIGRPISWRPTGGDQGRDRTGHMVMLSLPCSGKRAGAKAGFFRAGDTTGRGRPGASVEPKTSLPAATHVGPKAKYCSGTYCTRLVIPVLSDRSSPVLRIRGVEDWSAGASRPAGHSSTLRRRGRSEPSRCPARRLRPGGDTAMAQIHRRRRVCGAVIVRAACFV